MLPKALWCADWVSWGSNHLPSGSSSAPELIQLLVPSGGFSCSFLTVNMGFYGVSYAKCLFIFSVWSSFGEWNCFFFKFICAFLLFICVSVHALIKSMHVACELSSHTWLRPFFFIYFNLGFILFVNSVYSIHLCTHMYLLLSTSLPTRTLVIPQPN